MQLLGGRGLCLRPGSGEFPVMDLNPLVCYEAVFLWPWCHGANVSLLKRVANNLMRCVYQSFHKEWRSCSNSISS